MAMTGEWARHARLSWPWACGCSRRLRLRWGYAVDPVATGAATVSIRDPFSPRGGTRARGQLADRSLSQRDAEATLRQHGLGKWIEQFRPLSLFTSDTVLTLVIEDGGRDLYGQPGRWTSLR